MLNKLQSHLIPFFGEYRVDAIDEELVEAYIEQKERENALGERRRQLLTACFSAMPKRPPRGGIKADKGREQPHHDVSPPRPATQNYTVCRL